MEKKEQSEAASTSQKHVHLSPVKSEWLILSQKTLHCYRSELKPTTPSKSIHYKLQKFFWSSSERHLREPRYEPKEVKAKFC